MDEHTPAFKIFHYHFRCETPAINTITQNQINTIGLIVSGNREIDRQAMRDLVSVQWTIAEMAEKYSEGASFFLTTPDTDAPKIYQIIKQHLEDWQQMALHSLVNTDIPLEDLHKLDQLAAEVYKVARHYIKDPIKTGIFARLETLQRRSYGGPVVKRPDSPEMKPMAIAQEHTSIMDTIAQVDMARTGQWRQ